MALLIYSSPYTILHNLQYTYIGRGNMGEGGWGADDPYLLLVCNILKRKKKVKK